MAGQPQAIPGQSVRSGPRPGRKERWVVWMTTFLQLNVVQLIVVYQTEVSLYLNVGRDGHRMLQMRR